MLKNNIWNCYAVALIHFKLTETLEKIADTWVKEPPMWHLR